MSIPGDFGRAARSYHELAMIEEWGNAIRYGWIEDAGGDRSKGFFRDLDERQVTTNLRWDAEQTLPPSTRYEIRQALPWNYGRSKARAWYSTPTMELEPLWIEPGEEREPAYMPEGGYFLVGRYVTPAVKRKRHQPGLRVHMSPPSDDSRAYRVYQIESKRGRAPASRLRRLFGALIYADYGIERAWMDHLRAVKRWWRAWRGR